MNAIAAHLLDRLVAKALAVVHVALPLPTALAPLRAGQKLLVLKMRLMI